jgi:hypothetical protein
MKMSRAYTAEEARKILLDQMRDYAQYWSTVTDRSVEEKMSGLCFSILNIFDGTTLILPGMDIVLRPHPDDKQYHIEEDSDYFEEGMIINDCVLHDQWYKP